MISRGRLVRKLLYLQATGTLSYAVASGGHEGTPVMSSVQQLEHTLVLQWG